MKRFLAALAVLLLCVATAFAHSGGTDKNGGHYNRSTGEYHYHHGYPEHQHPGGVCPYEKKSTTTTYKTTNTTAYKTTTTSSNTKADSKNDDGSFPVGLLAGAGGASAAFWLFGRKKT